MSAPAPSQAKALRKLFLTIFLRGRSSRGLQQKGAPKSVAVKLGWSLFFYALIGAFMSFSLTQSIFAGSIILHTSTLMFIGMFVAASAGEALFNKEEGDILLHRPITPRALLWAKVRVMVEVAVWLALALNFGGLIVGGLHSNPRGLYAVAHTISVTLAALFCAGGVVVSYQLCLRWFGRERLDGMITTAQTLMSIAIVAGSQLGSQFMLRNNVRIASAADSWWILFVPSAWFAGFDDAIAGSHAPGSWMLAALAVIATGLLLWVGFGTLARDYASGLQSLNDTASVRPGKGRSQLLRKLVHLFPFSLWLRDPITRASFLLCGHYLMRDRDVKLRVFPGIAPMLVMPIIMLLPQRGTADTASFMLPMAGTYLGMVPLFGLTLLRYSQQWQAADIFRCAPMAGPGPVIHGARKAVFLFLTVPTILIVAIIISFIGSRPQDLVMLIPGLITLPIFGLLPCVTGEAVPLSETPETARSAKRGLNMIVVMIFSLLIAAAAMLARKFGVYWYFIALELIMASLVYLLLMFRCQKLRWRPID